MKTMKKTNKKKGLRGAALTLALALSVGLTMGQMQTVFAADRKPVKSVNLKSKQLVNPNRDYMEKHHDIDVVSIKNVDDIYDYVVMPDLQGQDMGGTDHLKYLVIHETDNTTPTATAIANYHGLVASGNNATWIIDEDTVVQGTSMNIKSRAIGKTDSSKSDISNDNSVNISIAVNDGGDYSKTVANAVHLTREVLSEHPLELARHYDAFSEINALTGEGYHKMCPSIMLSKKTWWTWDRFVFFATNPELPIPFIDFNPENTKEIPQELKGLDIMKQSSRKATKKAKKKANKKQKVAIDKVVTNMNII